MMGVCRLMILMVDRNGGKGGEALGDRTKDIAEGNDTSDSNLVRLSAGSMLLALVSAFVI